MMWQTAVAEVIRSFAYLLAVIALCWRFSDRQAAVLGASRWVVVAMLSGVAILQWGILTASLFGYNAAAGGARLTEACLLLATSIMLWPFLLNAKNRLTRAAGDSLQNQVEAAEARAAQARQWLELAEKMAHVGHWSIGVPGNEMFWSDEIYRIHGLSKESYVPDIVSAMAVFPPEDRRRIEAATSRAIAEKSGFEWEAKLIRPDGRIRTVMSRGIAQRDAAGNVIRLFGVFLDVTVQKETEEELRDGNIQLAHANQSLRQLALVDSLTGLPNRRHFDVTLAFEFKRAVRDGTQLGLIMIDLDFFKGFNDLYGHPAGDECLGLIGSAIAAVARRPGDLVARYGGEELVVVLPQTDAAGANAVADRILAAVRQLRVEHLGNPAKIVTVSCGVAILARIEAGQTAAMLVQRADQALYRAKLGGRDRKEGDTGTNCQHNQPLGITRTG